MAWIREKASGALLVGWRENGKKLSRQFATREEAEAFKREVEGKILAREVLSQPVPWAFDAPDTFVDPEAVEPEYEFATYLRTMIEADRELRITTKELYLRNIRVHIDGTSLAKADIRTVSPEMLTKWWASLDAGIGALRSIQQLLSKAFNRAVQTGLIDVSPLRRAPEVKRPSNSRQTEVIPLTVEEIMRLAGAARTQRDRLEIMLMAAFAREAA